MLRVPGSGTADGWKLAEAFTTPPPLSTIKIPVTLLPLYHVPVKQPLELAQVS